MKKEEKPKIEIILDKLQIIDKTLDSHYQECKDFENTCIYLKKDVKTPKLK